MTDTVRFPCGGDYDVGDLVATHRLVRRVAAAPGELWSNDTIVASRTQGDRFFRVQYGPEPLEVSFLRARAADYAGGTWRGADALALILTKDGEDLVLSIHRATGKPGPLAVSGLDGPNA